MARALNSALAVLLAAASPGQAECIFDSDDEITNPFAPGCGDVVLTYTEDDNSGDNIALGYTPPLPVASLSPVDGFRDYESLFARQQSLVTIHDEVSGHLVGHTVSGREIWAYRVSDADAVTAEGFPEAAVLVNGGIHAREWQTPEAVTGLLERLVTTKADSAIAQYLVEQLNTVLLPVNNVDGFLQSQQFPVTTTADRAQPREGRMRRKNLRNPQNQAAIDSNLGTVADNFWGVDLNRNSLQGFGQFGFSSDSFTSLVYRGASPESEPELLALHAAAALGPADRLRFYSDTHSFGQVYLAPTTGQLRRDAITADLAARMAAASARNYRFLADPPGSTGIGTTADHFAFTYEIPAWTMELEPRSGGQDYGGLAGHGHSGFILPASEVARMREDVAAQYLLGFYRQSGPPAAIAAQILDRESGLVVYEANWQMLNATSRTLSTVVNEALVPGRQYRLWIAFNKPMRTRDADGAVVAYPGQDTGAAVGAVALEIPSLSGSDIALDTAAQWLGLPGGAPDGYLRYRDDAFFADFTLPADISVASAVPAVLSLAVADAAEMSLDSNPATAVDWSNGGWTGYENAQGQAGDEGGPSCQFRPFVAMQQNAAPPATTADCKAAGSAAPPPPPPPAPAPPPASVGGGGAAPWFALLAGWLWLRGVAGPRRMSQPGYDGQLRWLAEFPSRPPPSSARTRSG